MRIALLIIALVLPLTVSADPPGRRHHDDRRERQSPEVHLHQRLQKLLTDVSEIQGMILTWDGDRRGRKHLQRRLEKLQREISRLIVAVPPVVPRAGMEPPPVVEEPAGPEAMPEADFSDFLKSVRHASFTKDRLRIITMVAKENWFLVDQVNRLLKALSFENDKLAAVEAMAPHIIDRNNRYKIFDHFNLSSSKKKLQRILR